MKVTFKREDYGDSVSIEVEGDDLNLQEVIEQLVRPALQALGYQESTITESLGDVDYTALATTHG